MVELKQIYFALIQLFFFAILNVSKSLNKGVCQVIVWIDFLEVLLEKPYSVDVLLVHLLAEVIRVSQQLDDDIAKVIVTYIYR